MKKTLLFVIVVAMTANLSSPLQAQQPYFREGYFSSPLPDLKHVTGIASDKNHCIWFSSQTGIYRFDGSRFRHFSVQSTPFLKFERMMGITMLNGNKGPRWAIMDAKDNFYEVDEQSRLIPFQSSAADNEIINYHQFGFPVFNVQHNKSVDTLRANTFELHGSPSGNRVFIATLKGEILTMSYKDLMAGKKGEIIAKQDPSMLAGKLQLVNDNFYMLTANSMISWKNGLKEPQRITISGDLNGPVNYSDLNVVRTSEPGQFLIWYRGNVYEMRESANTNELNAQLLITTSVSEIPTICYYSKPRHLFIAFYPKKGLSFYRPHQFTLLTSVSASDHLILPEYYYSLIPEDSGLLTINEKGVIWMNIQGSKKFRINSPSSKYFLFKDKQGNIWYHDQKINSISYLEPKSNNRIAVPLKKQFNTALSGIHQASDTEYYLLTNRELKKLVIINGKIISDDLLYFSPVGIELNVLYHKDDNTFWIGSDQGMFEYNIADKTIKDVEGLQNKYIRAVKKIKPDKYLVGTYDKGLFLSYGKNWVPLKSDNRKMPSSAHAVVEDNTDAAVWISSNEGIIRIALSQLLSDDSTIARKIVFRHFSNFGPGISPEFNGSSNISGARLSDSTIAFANANGIVVFDPVKLHSQPLPETILVEPLGNDSLLNKNSRQLAFDVVVPYFGNLDDLEILYYLTNADQEWHRYTTNSTINYNNLSPGEHELRFKIKYFHDPGGKEVVLTAKKIVIPHRWYQKTWFYVLCGIVTLAVIMLLHNIRLWYVLKRKKELERLVKNKTAELVESNQVLTDVIEELSLSESNLRQSNFLKDEYYAVLTHDLRSPLKFLSFNIGQLMEHNLSSGDEKLKKGLTAAYQCSTDVYKLIDEFVYWIRDNEHQLQVKPENTSVLSVVEDIRKVYAYGFEGNNNKLVISIPAELKFNTDPKLLFIILRNAIDNANKYTRDGIITVSASNLNGNLELAVSDTGRGIKKEVADELVALQYITEPLNYKKRKSLGFFIMAMLIRKLKGKYTIESGKEKGIILNFIIPESR